MKRIIILLLCATIFLLCNGNAQPEIPEKDSLSSHKIKHNFWYAKGGKIELTGGTWRFSAKETVIKAGSEEIVDVDYIVVCRFVIFNNSEAAYKINPYVTLVDYDCAMLWRVPPARYYAAGKEAEDFRAFYDKIRPFKPKVLTPGEGYSYEEEFKVSRNTVLKTSRLKVELSILEIKE